MPYNKIKPHNQRAKVYVIAIASLLVLTGPAARADNGPSSESMQEWARASLAKDYAWFNALWTGDDSPYRNIRNSIDHDLARGQKPRTILQRYEDTAKQQPNSPEAVFAYGYAVYKAATLPNAISGAEAFQGEAKVYDAWEKVHAPHTYNYARVMFLQESLGAPDPKLIGVGKRLLARNLNDYEIEYGLAVMANVSTNSSDRSQAKAYQQDLARRFPHDPRQYRLLAGIYRITAQRSHSQAEAEKSIAAYRQYLTLAPEFRASTEDDIRLMKELQAMWRNG